MKVVCPECGFVGDLAAFLIALGAREATTAALRIPGAIASQVIAYMGLFRPQRRATSFGKLARLLNELADMIESGEVTFDGQRRPATVEVWREAIEKMLEGRDKLTLPLSSHGYLRRVALACAERDAARAEHKQETERRRPYRAGEQRGAQSVADVLKRIKPHDYVPAGADTPSPLAGEGRGEV